jgi:hypothetical protein
MKDKILLPLMIGFILGKEIHTASYLDILNAYVNSLPEKKRPKKGKKSAPRRKGQK